MTAKPKARLQASLSLEDRKKGSFTTQQISLLQAIAETGSITAAAKATGVSYKTAWDRVDAMNNMSEQPLVARNAGGSRGGGTRLTAFGEKIVAGFAAMAAEHQAFVETLGSQLNSVDDLAKFIRHTNLQTSARNQYRGVITALKPGAVNSEVQVRISDSVTLTALITKDSRSRMKLKKGDPVIALIKASWVLLSQAEGVMTSARNQLTGEISKITTGEVNSEVIIDLGDGKTLCAIITNQSVSDMVLKKKQRVGALFKASSVILMKL